MWKLLQTVAQRRQHTIRQLPGDVDDLQQELSFAVNWFFRGHLNKLTAEASLFAFGEEATDREDGWRFRMQWDISM